MELNVTYHWTYLDYMNPRVKEGNWGPVARAAIEVHAELPTPEGTKELHGIYKHLNIPITGTMGPKEEILKAIDDFAAQNGITIEMDFITGKADYWDEPF